MINYKPLLVHIELLSEVYLKWTLVRLFLKEKIGYKLNGDDQIIQPALLVNHLTLT